MKARRFVRRAVLISALATALVGAAIGQDASPPRHSLERRPCAPNTRISRVTIARVINVFDPQIKGEDNRIFRVFNRLHRPMLTRERTLRALLTVRVGDRCIDEDLEEAERVLRAYSFIQDAWVEAVDDGQGGAEVLVTVQDAWSTRIRASASKQGGATKTTIRLVEANLLGSGTKLAVQRSRDQDRTRKLFQYSNPALFGSRWRLSLLNSANSDGMDRRFEIEQPFYQLAAPRSYAFAFDEQHRELKVYRHGQEIDRWRRDAQTMRIRFGWNPYGYVNQKTFRWFTGLQRQSTKWQLVGPSIPNAPDLAPIDRDLLVMRNVLSWNRIDFRRVQHINTFRRVEDLSLGRTIETGFTVSVPGLSKDRLTAWDIAYFQGFALGKRTFLQISGSHQIKRLNGDWREAITAWQIRFFSRWSERQTLAARLLLARGSQLEGPDRFLLGGDTGLRGYRSRAFAGDNLALLVVEQRFFAHWEIARLFTVGAVAFLEAGAAWDERESLGWSDIHPDAGLGLRIYSQRSSGRTIVHLNLAYPFGPNVDPGAAGPVFSVSTAKTF